MTFNLSTFLLQVATQHNKLFSSFLILVLHCCSCASALTTDTDKLLVYYSNAGGTKLIRSVIFIVGHGAGRKASFAIKGSATFKHFC